MAHLNLVIIPYFSMHLKKSFLLNHLTNISLTVIMLLVMAANGLAQNLVPNPSFEDTISCPAGPGQIYKTQNWVTCGNSSDYFNSCSDNNTSGVGVPLNLLGFQNAFTGNAYCGLWTYSDASFYREFIGTYLTQPLMAGNTYYVSFKCATGSPNTGACVNTDKLGVRFSTFQPDSANLPSINNVAHVYTDNVVSDTSNWTTISGFFTADSNYTFLTIGNFFDDFNTDTLNPYGNSIAYYYIDDVYVTDSTTSIADLNNQNKKINIYISSGKLIVNTKKPIKRLLIYDISGKLVLNKNNLSANDSININKISNGIYIIKIKTSNSEYIQKQILYNP